MVTILKYKKITIDHTIYIKIFSGGTVSYLVFSTDDVRNTNSNKTTFTELRKFFEVAFEIKFQEGYVLNYMDFRVFWYPLGFSIYQNDHIMEIVI